MRKARCITPLEVNAHDEVYRFPSAMNAGATAIEYGLIAAGCDWR
jgi:hypothetical protein